MSDPQSQPQTVSVAMATYNGARYLRQQLDSFAAQTRLPDELVISDDNSSDATAGAVADFAMTAPFPIRFEVNAERLGYNRNFERAIGRCTGDVVLISDQDDEWFAGKIAAVTALLAANPRALAAANNQSIATPEGADTGTTVLGNVLASGYTLADYGPGCCSALRRPLIDILSPFPGDAVPYDHWITIIPHLLGARVLHREPLQTYRRHASNATGSLFARSDLSGWAVAANAVTLDAHAAYGAKIDGNALIAARLRERRAAIAELGLGDRVDGALASLAEESAAYAARLDALRRPRLARAPHVLRMLRGGTYTRFRGLRSALKDLVAL